MNEKKKTAPKLVPSDCGPPWRPYSTVYFQDEPHQIRSPARKPAMKIVKGSTE